MSLGTSKITPLGKIPNSARVGLLNDKYFLHRLRQDQGKFLSNISTNTDKLVVEILHFLNINTTNNLIEYWFQYQTEGQTLNPHCDYNTKARKELPTSNIKEFLEGRDSRHYLSEKTVAVYLEVSDDLLGGDLCISNDYTYLSENVTEKDILSGSFERYSPVENCVIEFQGSKYYHWIDKVLRGSRKSLLINFWPKDMIYE